MNQITVYGNLTADPTLRTVNGKNGQQTCCDLRIADNHYVYGQADKGVTFYTHTVWGPRAESMPKFLHKGSRVIVHGMLNVREYTTKDGRKGFSYEILQPETVTFCDGASQTQEATVPKTDYDQPMQSVASDELPF